MKDVKILGPGCPKCGDLYRLTELVARQMGLDCQIEKVTDMRQITSYGVMMTPALVVDGVVKVSGKVPSPEDLKEMLA